MILMKDNENASLSLIKIICIGLIFIICSGIYVLANNSEVDSIKIVLSNNYEMTVLTSKTKVSEILQENHIMVLNEEIVVPTLEQEIDANKTIIISKDKEKVKPVTIAQVTEYPTLEQILENHSPIIEKIVVEKVEIPFETVTKTVTSETKDVYNKVIQSGRNGLKEVTYRVKYQNEKEIEKTELCSTIIKEPRNRIVQVQKKTTRALSGGRIAADNPATTASTALAKKVEGITPIVKTFNASAYCACVSCCGKTNGITASGAKASAWYTIAAGSGLKFGTVIYIPSLKNKPNGGWFVVQDRGGAISNSKIDIFTGTHSQALQFGRRNVECYVYEF